MYIFCEESKVGIWFFNHVFYIVGGLSLLFCLTIGLKWGWASLRNVGTLAIVATFLILASLCRLAFHNVCSRVEINIATEKIRFFRFFNKKIVEAPVRSVEFCCAYRFTCIYAGEKFVIPPGYTNSMAEVLPEGVEIKFGEGFWGRLAKRQYQKRKK